MDGLIVLLFLAAVGLGFMGILGLFTRNGKARKRLKWAAIALVGSIVLAGISGPEEETEEIATEVTEVTEEVTKETEPATEVVAENPKPAEKAPPAEPEPEPKPEEQPFTLGDKVQAGNFEYIITAVNETNVIDSDNEFIESKKTEGKFAVIDYSVKNLDKEARMVDSDLFMIIDANGNEYESMVDGDIFMLLGDKNLFLESVNPGLSRSGQVVFELPADVNTYDLVLASGLGWAGGEYEVVKLK